MTSVTGGIHLAHINRAGQTQAVIQMPGGYGHGRMLGAGRIASME
jgi:hypothetical protein